MLPLPQMVPKGRANFLAVEVSGRPVGRTLHWPSPLGCPSPLQRDAGPDRVADLRYRVLPVGLGPPAHDQEVAARRRDVVGGAQVLERVGEAVGARPQVPRAPLAEADD